MRKGRWGGKRTALEQLTHFLDIPANILPWGMDLEIQNDCDVFVGGCTGISEYTKERVVFCGKGMKIIVSGRDFELFTFADGRVNLTGKVDSIVLERGGDDD